jgi:hypothetical protein
MPSSILILLAIAAFVVAAGTGFLVWQITHYRKIRRSAQRIAGALGWKVVMAGHGYTEWFQGDAHARQAAVRFLVKPRQFQISHGVRVQYVLRVALEIAVPRPLGIEAVHQSQVSDSSGAVRFQASGNGRLPAAGQAAITAFSGTLLPAGLSGVVLRTSPITRHLRLTDRQQLRSADMDAGVLSSARAVLIHDYPHPNVGPEDFRKILYDLATVAYAIEQSVR